MRPAPPSQDLLRAVGSLLDREGRREAAEASGTPRGRRGRW